MEKVRIDWKSPSEKSMMTFVSKLDNEMKKEFALCCIEVDKQGVNLLNKRKAKVWLEEKFDDAIEWTNKPKSKRVRSADIIASWKDL